MKKAIALAVAVAAASGANAAWVPGTMTNPAGELVLTVWDSAQAKAFSQDLGILASDAIAGKIADGYTVSLSSAGLAHLGTYDNLKWNLAGSSADSAAAYDAATGRLNTGVYFTNSGLVPTTPIEPFSALPALSNSAFFTYNTAVFQGNTDENPVVLTSGAGAHAGENPIWGNEMAGFIGPATETTSSVGANGDTLAIMIFTAIADADFNITPVIEQGGYWTLNAGMGTLTYSTGVSAVPVPAAAWLFGSALLGLGSIARTRKA